jgi:tRNA-specific 2-thiouridylase
VKFTDLVALARDLGCEALATGHYAAARRGPHGAELHRAADPARDQSLFPGDDDAAQLAFARFPLGDMPDKAAVRAVAARLGLPVAEKPDSQDICFVPLRPLCRRRREAAARGRRAGRDRGRGRQCSAPIAASRATRSGRAAAWARRSGGAAVRRGIDAPRRRVVVARAPPCRGRGGGAAR